MRERVKPPTQPVEHPAAGRRGSGLTALLGVVGIADSVHADLHAPVTNEDARPGNELAHVVLALAAKRAEERLPKQTAEPDHSRSLVPQAPSHARHTHT